MEMFQKTVKEFLIRTLDEGELQSYLQYIGGDVKQTDWIEKVSEQRDYILAKELRCSTCNNYISIFETGVCKCSIGCLGQLYSYGLVVSSFGED